MPGMDGTGLLFERLEQALGQPCTRVAYYRDRLLSYDQLLPELPDGDGLILVGESFSGPLAIRLAAAHPERVRGLVLCATFARLPWPSGVRRLAGAVMRGPVPVHPPRALIRALLTGADAPEDLVDDVDAAIRSVRPEVFRQRIRDVLAVDVREAFQQVRAPVLYLQASRDRLVAPEAVRELQALRPDLEVAVLDAPHLLLQRRPVEAAALLDRFA